eukprot:SAG31_NODE_37784_length_301_cov_1.029703_1_plen_35_part_10
MKNGTQLIYAAAATAGGGNQGGRLSEGRCAYTAVT